ncbi:MAG: 3-deoxy-7-phosphoheptulonate synthase [Candidatus Riflebacteria bacterium]|nr:3-deoxy-7-phosphoheptulonate synthase [Candidatus Riflebacteria bacterium]
MIIVFKPEATDKHIERVVERLKEIGMTPHLSRGVARTILGAIGDERLLEEHPLDAFEGIERIIPILKPYKLASREFKNDDTVVDVDGVKVGGETFTVMAGPCAVESEEQVLRIAHFLKERGVRIMRGGAFKPRTSPYAFQGLGLEGLKLLSKVRSETGLKIVTEVLDAQNADLVAQHVDILQIGARNMQNFELLKKCGRLRRPVLLKRGMSSTIQELFLAAEYILMEGNHDVILCERGIKTFETFTRNTLDISAVPIAKLESHLPIIVDPSHAAGFRAIIPALARTAVAAGADGIIVEVHYDPEKALCDGQQALRESDFDRLMDEVRRVAAVMGRTVQ